MVEKQGGRKSWRNRVERFARQGREEELEKQSRTFCLSGEGGRAGETESKVVHVREGGRAGETESKVLKRCVSCIMSPKAGSLW